MLGPRNVEKDFNVTVVVARYQDVAAVEGGSVGIALGFRMFNLKKRLKLIMLLTFKDQNKPFPIKSDKNKIPLNSRML
jgi:hypothetical protein